MRKLLGWSAAILFAGGIGFMYAFYATHQRWTMYAATASWAGVLALVFLLDDRHWHE